MLFTGAVKLHDNEDLDRLENFAKSFKPHNIIRGEDATQPFQLYEFLGREAGLHVESSASGIYSLSSPTAKGEEDDMSKENDIEMLALDDISHGMTGPDSESGFSNDLGAWLLDNRQLMGFVNDDKRF